MLVVAVLVIATGVILVMRRSAAVVTAQHLDSVAVTASLARLAQAESVYFAQHGRFSGDRAALTELMPLLADTTVELQFVRADSVAWRVVGRRRGARAGCGLSGSAGRPTPSFAEVHARCVGR